MVSRKKRPIHKDQCWRNKKKACRNTKRVKNGPSGPTYKKKDWSTRAATSCEEAQNLIASPTSLIIVDVSTLTFIGLGITLRLCQSSMFVCCTLSRKCSVVCLHLDAVSEWKGLMLGCVSRSFTDFRINCAQLLYSLVPRPALAIVVWERDP